MIDKEKRYRDVIADLENEISRLKRQNVELLGALKEYCQYHDLPLKNGKFHVLNPGRGNKVRWVDCELSEKARQAITQAKGE